MGGVAFRVCGTLLNVSHIDWKRNVQHHMVLFDLWGPCHAALWSSNLQWEASRCASFIWGCLSGLPLKLMISLSLLLHLICLFWVAQPLEQRLWIEVFIFLFLCWIVYSANSYQKLFKTLYLIVHFLSHHVVFYIFFYSETLLNHSILCKCVYMQVSAGEEVAVWLSQIKLHSSASDSLEKNKPF